MPARINELGDGVPPVRATTTTEFVLTVMFLFNEFDNEELAALSNEALKSVVCNVVSIPLL